MNVIDAPYSVPTARAVEVAELVLADLEATKRERVARYGRAVRNERAGAIGECPRHVAFLVGNIDREIAAARHALEVMRGARERAATTT